MVDAVVSDLECIISKLRDAVDGEEQLKRALTRKDRDENEKDPIAQAVKLMVENTLELMADIGELMFALIVANPLDDSEMFIAESMLHFVAFKFKYICWYTFTVYRIIIFTNLLFY